MDEMWGFYGDKGDQLWLWWAMDHDTGVVIAYWFGTREHSNLDKLKVLLVPLKLEKVYTDGNYAYVERFSSAVLVVSKKNTKKIERKHLSLRTWCSRLVRKGIRQVFSRVSKSRLPFIISVSLPLNQWYNLQCLSAKHPPLRQIPCRFEPT